jgi:hypothetical protein
MATEARVSWRRLDPALTEGGRAAILAALIENAGLEHESVHRLDRLLREASGGAFGRVSRRALSAGRQHRVETV